MDKQTTELLKKIIVGKWRAETTNSWVADFNEVWGDYLTKEDALKAAKMSVTQHNDSGSHANAIFELELSGEEILTLVNQILINV